MIDRFRTKEKKSRRLIKYCKLTNNFLKSCPRNTRMKRFLEIVLGAAKISIPPLAIWTLSTTHILDTGIEAKQHIATSK